MQNETISSIVEVTIFYLFWECIQYRVAQKYFAGVLFYRLEINFLFYVGSYVCYLEQRGICPTISLLWFLVTPNTRSLNHPLVISVNHPFKLGITRTVRNRREGVSGWTWNQTSGITMNKGTNLFVQMAYHFSQLLC